jgi:hypothetical protein
MLLSKAILITSIGDYAGLFVYFILLEKLNNNTVYSGYSIAAKALAAIAAFFLLKKLNFKSDQKVILVSTQFIMGIISLSLIFLLELNLISNAIIIGYCFIQAVLFEQFKMCRDLYSKAIADKVTDNNGVYREHQANIEFGLKVGQMFGPLVFFIVANILKLPLWTPLLFDTISFFISGYILLKLTSTEFQHSESSEIELSKGFTSLWNKEIFLYFLMKSTFVISASLYNILIFRLISSKFKLDSSYIPITYSVLSIGSVLAANILKSSDKYISVFKKNFNVNTKEDSLLIIVGSIIFAFCISSFYFDYDFKHLLIILFFAGIGNTFQVVSIRAVLQSFSTLSEFSKINPIDIINTRGLEALCTILVIHLGYLVSDNFLITIVVILSLTSAILPFTYSHSALFKNSQKMRAKT